MTDRDTPAPSLAKKLEQYADLDDANASGDGSPMGRRFYAARARVMREAAARLLERAPEADFNPEVIAAREAAVDRGESIPAAEVFAQLRREAGPGEPRAGKVHPDCVAGRCGYVECQGAARGVPCFVSPDWCRAAPGEEVRERIRAGGNPLEHLTPEDIAVAKADPRPEIVGRRPFLEGSHG